MACLLTYSPPSTSEGHEKVSPDYPTIARLSEYLIELVESNPGEKISIVLSDGRTGRHPHLHALHTTRVRADNLRSKIAKKLKINIKEYTNILQVKTAKSDGGWYPARKYLIANSLEKGGKVLRDDHSLSDMDDHSESGTLKAISKQKFIEEIDRYVVGFLRAAGETEVHKSTFLAAVGDVVSRGYDISSHLRYLDPVYHQIMIMHGTDPRVLNLLKD